MYYSVRAALFLSTICCFLHTAYPQQVPYDDITYSKGTFFGNQRNDSYLLHVAVDSKGFIYGTGLCTDIPATAGAYRTTNAGQYDVMVFKMDPTMTRLIWATYIGGANNEGGGSISVNAQGEVFVSGYTLSANFPTTNAADNTYLVNNTVNYFCLKLSSDGSRLLYSRILGNGAPITQQTQSASKGAQLAISPNGDAFVYAHTASNRYTITTNAYQSAAAGGMDLVLTKLDSNGTIVYSTFLGGSQNERSGDIAYANGKLYCVGSTASGNLPLRYGKTPDANDCFVMVTDDGAVPTPRRFFVFGSSGLDTGITVNYDAHAQRVCLAGRAQATSTNFPYTSVLQYNQRGGGWVASVDSGLTQILYATMIGTFITPTSIIARSNSSVYVAGYTSGSVPLSPNAYQTSLRGSMDGMMMSLDSIGSNLRYGTYIGGSSHDYSAAKVLLFEQECLLRVIFGITTHSTDFPSSADSYQPLKKNGGEDQGALALFSAAEGLTFSYSVKPCSKEATLRIDVPCAPLNVVWDFGDGTRAVNQSPITHVYPRAGTYSLTATLWYPEPDTIVIKRSIVINEGSVVDAGQDISVCLKSNRTQLWAFGVQQYRWSPGKSVSDSTIPNPWIAPTQTTRYYVRGVDAFGCESMDSVTVYVQDLIAKAEKDTTICEGQSVQLRAIGGRYVNWMPSTGLNSVSGITVTASPTKTTTYRALVSDGFCFDTAKVTVNVIPKPKITMPPSPTICKNGSARLTPALSISDTSGIIFLWSPAVAISSLTTLQTTVSPQRSTWYKLTAVTPKGCTTTDSIFVAVQNTLSVSVPADTGICTGGSVQLWARGGMQYRWVPETGLSSANSPVPMCTPTKTTTYTVYATSGVCADTQHVTVYVRELPTVTAIGDTTVCQGERVCVKVQHPKPNETYTWYPAQNFEVSTGEVAYLRTTTTSTYSVVAANEYGCTATDSVTIHIDNALTVQAGNDASVCYGDMTVLQVVGEYDTNTTFSWYPNNGIYNPSTKEYTVQGNNTQTYIVRGMRGACIGEDTVQLTVRPLPQFTVMPDTTICLGSVAQLVVQSNEPTITYRWLRNSQPDELLVHPYGSMVTTTALQQQTDFTVVAMNNGCISTKTVTVAMRDLPQLILPQQALVCPNESATFTVQSPQMASAVWQPPLGLNTTTSPTVTAIVDKTSLYTVTVTDSAGCVNTADYIINVKPRIPVAFSVSSARTATGTDTVIVVYANSQTPIVTDVQLDVVCNADIFSPTDSTEHNINADKRFMRVKLSRIQLTNTSREIARIQGHTLVSPSHKSSVTIQNSVVDPTYCPTIATDSSEITIESCVLPLRNVMILDKLTADVAPNPAGETTTLHVHTLEQTGIKATLLDELSREVRTWELTFTPPDAKYPLSLDGIAAGVYTLVLKTGFQETTLRLVKE
ncbi:MAG: PKD domain-containing protein [Bacteriodetes bacterium]|nr:PKD domain-containing protein [Bacteroidota bacterium]